MMKPLFASLLAAASLCFAATCASASPVIELKDGSRIQGDIQGIEHGEYTIVSPTLGKLHVAQSDIVRIVYGGAHAASEPAGADATPRNQELSGQALQLQAQLAQDPEAMKSILGLQSDPQIQALMNDPAIVQAIQQGDYMGLLDNPKIKALENNAQIKELLQRYGQ